MSRAQAGWFGVLLALAVLVAVLALRNPKPPFLPADENHTDFSTCNDCHGADGPAPRSTEHPIGEDCGRCHARR